MTNSEAPDTHFDFHRALPTVEDDHNFGMPDPRGARCSEWGIGSYSFTYSAPWLLPLIHIYMTYPPEIKG